MDSRAEHPTKAAAGYLKELNAIIETQQTLLERQKRRILELEQRVTELRAENIRLRHEHQRHLLACRLRSAPDTSPPRLQSEYSSTRIGRRHASLPVGVTDGPSSLRSAVCRRTGPSRQWTATGNDHVLHQFCCPPSGNSSPSR